MEFGMPFDFDATASDPEEYEYSASEERMVKASEMSNGVFPQVRMVKDNVLDPSAYVGESLRVLPAAGLAVTVSKGIAMVEGAHAYIRTRMNIDLSLLKAIKVRIVSAHTNHNDNGGNSYCRISCGGSWGLGSDKYLYNTVISIPISETLTSAQFEMYCEVGVAGWREESASASLTISEMWGEFR